MLKQSNQLGKISALKEALTNTFIHQFPLQASKLVFGNGLKNAEIITRQYLLIQFGGLTLNEAILSAEGRPGSNIMHPLPPEWRKVLEHHDFKLAKIRVALLWNGYMVVFLAYGMLHIVKTIFQGIQEIIKPRYKNLGRYVYFEDLGPSNLPQPDNDGISYDIVSWYAQWTGRADNIETLCHSVPLVSPGTSGGLPVIAVPYAIPPINTFNSLMRYVEWGIVASIFSITDLLRGRWWHACFLREASKAAVIRLHQSHQLARHYLFHNSGWIYRPLWTYEAEKQGSSIIFYFYSTNTEAFKRSDGYPPLPYGWQAMNWPYYLVWDEYQADFVRRAVGPNTNLSVVGSIPIQTSVKTIQKMPPRAIAVFDVQPFRNSFYQRLGIAQEYYTPRTANQFLMDIHIALKEYYGVMVLKRKRDIGGMLHPKYKALIGQLNSSEDFIAIDPALNATRVIEACAAVISMPFTSTALLGRELGKPSIYYDPHGTVQKDDRAAHGIKILHGFDELIAWISTIINSDVDSSL
ncbi:MAG: polysaccharide biosynthesis PFTS motif protein [SAR324 cluster bacterium]|nr:polysaccharide biosynthesis PFTS motif protein [SAR324 cluster bacterium]